MDAARYLRWFAVSGLGCFAAVWLWVAFAPMAFMEPEYPAWQAKRILIQSCDLGEAIVLGDSRAAAGILPGSMPVRTVNLALGGGEPVEALSVLRRVLDCPNLPRLAIVSFDPTHFLRPDLYWERSVRFGFQSANDIAALRALSRRTGDNAVYEERHADGLPSLLRDWLQEARFPVWYFSSLVHGGVVGRWAGNEERLARALASRGQYYFGRNEGSATVAADGKLRSFHPLPVLDRSFDTLLAMLQQRGVEMVFVAMPVNEATWAAGNAAVRSAFAAYLAEYERRYSRFHVLHGLPAHWPNGLFGDGFSHLNPDGAKRFSGVLAERLERNLRPPSSQPLSLRVAHRPAVERP